MSALRLLRFRLKKTVHVSACLGPLWILFCCCCFLVCLCRGILFSLIRFHRFTAQVTLKEHSTLTVNAQCSYDMWNQIQKSNQTYLASVIFLIKAHTGLVFCSSFFSASRSVIKFSDPADSVGKHHEGEKTRKKILFLTVLLKSNVK